MQHQLTQLLEPPEGSAGHRYLVEHFWDSCHQLDRAGKTVVHRLCESNPISNEIFDAMFDIFPCCTPEEPLHMCTVQMHARGLVRCSASLMRTLYARVPAPRANTCTVVGLFVHGSLIAFSVLRSSRPRGQPWRSSLRFAVAPAWGSSPGRMRTSMGKQRRRIICKNR